MSVIELEPPVAPPDLPPPGVTDMRDFERQFGPPQTEPHPTDDLVGRALLEDRVSGAETYHEQGIFLTAEEVALMALAREYVDFDTDDRAF